MLELFLFPPARQSTPIGRLSGGERRRLYLARLLMGAPNILLLDEPTNDFDIATLVALEAYLDSFAGCLIVASHDRYFLDRTIDQLFRIEEGGNLRGYPGNYTTYQDLKTQETAALKEAAAIRESSLTKTSSTGSPVPPAGQKAKPTKRTFKEQRELENVEKRIQHAETRKAEIENRLSNPDGDFAALTTLSQELLALNAQIDLDLNRWAELSERE